MPAMTQADFARRHDVSRKTVTKWKQSGLITMVGDCVDVEASDERLRKYRFAQDGRAQRGVKKQAQRFGAAPAGRVQLTEAEILRRLRDLDWRQEFDWSEEGQYERARLAAKCVGFEAVESDIQDDGHWGRLQLRDPNQIREGELTENAILAGYGFDAYPWEVLRLCRVQATPCEEDGDEPGDWTCTVDLRLLPLLAHPHFEDERPEQDPAGD